LVRPILITFEVPQSLELNCPACYILPFFQMNNFLIQLSIWFFEPMSSKTCQLS